MSEIVWGKEVQEALARAATGHKPVFLDFWFAG